MKKLRALLASKSVSDAEHLDDFRTGRQAYARLTTAHTVEEQSPTQLTHTNSGNNSNNPTARSTVNLLSITADSVILQKITQACKQAENLTVNEIRRYSRPFHDPDEMRSVYLDVHFSKTAELLRELSSLQRIIDNREPTSPESPPESARSHYYYYYHQYYDDLLDLSQDDVSESRASRHYRIAKKNVKVKVLLLEVSPSFTSTAVSFRKLLSPLLTRLEHDSFLIGLYRTAIVIGPWLLEWTPTSLVIPRACHHEAAMVIAEMDPGPQLQKHMLVEEAIEKVLPVIMNWNLNQRYHKTSANCQHFVDEVAAALGIETMLTTGLFAEIFGILRSNGEYQLDFATPAAMRPRPKKRFSNHRTLDKFICDLLEEEPRFENKYPEEWAILRTLDLSFWARFYRERNNENYHPRLFSESMDTYTGDNSTLLECPFGEPGHNVAGGLFFSS